MSNLWRDLSRCEKQNCFAWKYCSNSPKLTAQTEDFHAIINGFQQHGLKSCLFANILVNEQSCQPQLNFGASMNIIPVSYVDHNNSRRFTKRLELWNPMETGVLGKITLKVKNPKTSHCRGDQFLGNWKEFTTDSRTGCNSIIEFFRYKQHFLWKRCKKDIFAQYSQVFHSHLGRLSGRIRSFVV